MMRFARLSGCAGKRSVHRDTEPIDGNTVSEDIISRADNDGNGRRGCRQAGSGNSSRLYRMLSGPRSEPVKRKRLSGRRSNDAVAFEIVELNEMARRFGGRDLQ